MDYNAINTLVSKAFYNGDKIHFGTYAEKFIGIMTNHYVIYLIPENMFIFDKNKLANNGGESHLEVEKLIPKGDLEDAVLTGVTVKDIKKPSRSLSKLKSENYTVWVDTKFLKPFGKDITFKVKNEKTAVLIYKNNILIGLVCPVNYKEKEI